LSAAELAAELLRLTPDVEPGMGTLAAASSVARQEFMGFAQTEHRKRMTAARGPLAALGTRPESFRPPTLVQIARDHRASPVACAREVLRAVSAAAGGSARDQRSRVTAWLRDPATLDSGLAAAVEECVRADTEMGPGVDASRQELGDELELFMCGRLREMGVPFDDEAALRLRGCRVTPDALLLLPVAAVGPDGGAVLVNWIDSKAMVATYDVVQSHAEQCSAYVREHGRGAVVYWFGAEEGAEALAGSGVTVLTELPPFLALPGGRVASVRDGAAGVPYPRHLGDASEMLGCVARLVGERESAAQA